MNRPQKLRNPANPEEASAVNPKRSYRGSRRETQKRMTQARVLECALELFAERGFEAASLREIAGRAGVTHALIRLHFGSKAQLWQSAVDYLFRRMQTEMRPRPDELDYTDGADGVELFVRRYVAYCARHPEHARLMLMESMHDSDRLRYAVDKHIRPAHRFLESMLIAASKDIHGLEAAPAHLAYIVAAASQLVFALAHEARGIYGVDVLDEEFVARHADAVVNLLFKR